MHFPLYGLKSSSLVISLALGTSGLLDQLLLHIVSTHLLFLSWGSSGHLTVNEAHCSQGRGTEPVTLFLPVHCLSNMKAATAAVSHTWALLKQKSVFFSFSPFPLVLVRSPLKTITPILKWNSKSLETISSYISARRWSCGEGGQVDSKWILIFPLVLCSWFLAEWIYSYRVVRGWAV